MVNSINKLTHLKIIFCNTSVQAIGTCTTQRTTCGNQFSSSTTLWSQGLNASCQTQARSTLIHLDGHLYDLQMAPLMILHYKQHRLPHALRQSTFLVLLRLPLSPFLWFGQHSFFLDTTLKLIYHSSLSYQYDIALHLLGTAKGRYYRYLALSTQNFVLKFHLF